MMNSENRNGTLYLSGEVTVKTVTSAPYTKFRQQCRATETQQINLSSIVRADSACVSLLLEALRIKPNILLTGLPDSVRALAELYEIREWVKE